MKAPDTRRWAVLIALTALLVLLATLDAQGPPGSESPQRPGSQAGQAQPAASSETPAGLMPFPLGTATPSELCGACHKAIYREFATGFGSDLEYKAIVSQATTGTPL